MKMPVGGVLAAIGALAMLLTGHPGGGQQLPTDPIAQPLPADTEKRAWLDWKSYGGGPDNIHYSALRQINRDNVNRLMVAWTYDSGDAYPDSEMECNPIVVDGTLYATTPKHRLIAVDASTGTQRWSFDPLPGASALGKLRNRGVNYWADGADRRIFYAVRQYLYAVDAATGKPIPGFGDQGRVDLRQGLGRDPEQQSISSTSPGIVYQDLLIMGSIVAEDLPASPGDIRAYDVRTGKIRWTFHTIPHPGESGYETWPKDAWTYIGGANDWGGLALDERRGLVFAATGSAAFDFYGANRLGDDLFANCVIALKAATGERVWHFQGVKHDVWDRDFPAAPTLVTVQRNGKAVDAVAQITKSGLVFVFDRDTGQPLFPIEYRKVPASDVEGEQLAATQPFPLQPPPFARQMLTEDVATRRTPEARAAVLEQLRKLRNQGQFTPPSREGSVVFPGFDGGGEWGGPAFDPETGKLYVNANEMAWILRLVKRPETKLQASARAVYAARCANCHRPDLRGSPPEFPSLVGIGAKYKPAQMEKIIAEGRGRMPNFTRLGPNVIQAVADFLATGEDVEFATPLSEQLPRPLPYTIDGYNKFLDPEGYPAVAPPWGTLSAIDLEAGKIDWQIPLGEYPELAAKGLGITGCENYGGPLVTAGGLLFIGATIHDRKFRAFDKQTGKLLWETVLPAAGNATPATYEIDGRQFVVVAAGGGKWGLPSGGSYVAFALPPTKDKSLVSISK
ncbi:MAG TPA: PQQ-binding-like beta-propeller repeat protein [Terriglobia bacterium]|nr:PQQ-binding-like beta-propeller repeat protein [Terriglobia bacterium]